MRSKPNDFGKEELMKILVMYLFPIAIVLAMVYACLMFVYPPEDFSKKHENAATPKNVRAEPTTGSSSREIDNQYSEFIIKIESVDSIHMLLDTGGQMYRNATAVGYIEGKLVRFQMWDRHFEPIVKKDSFLRLRIPMKNVSTLLTGQFYLEKPMTVSNVNSSESEALSTRIGIETITDLPGYYQSK